VHHIFSLYWQESDRRAVEGLLFEFSISVRGEPWGEAGAPDLYVHDAVVPLTNLPLIRRTVEIKRRAELVARGNRNYLRTRP